MSIYVETEGQGPDLVLIHGWGLHGGVWEAAARRLAAHARVHRVDLPGHGRSPLDGEFTLARAAEAVAAWAPVGALWVGSSLGGMVALTAAAGGAPIGRLVLVGAPVRFMAEDDWPWAVQPAVLEGFFSELEQDWRGTLRRFVALQARGSERSREELRALREQLFAHGEPAAAALRGGLEVLRDADLRPLLARVSQPALVIQGERDTLVPAAAGERLAAGLPAGHLITIAGAGHAPFMSHPEAFERALLEFLNE